MKHLNAILATACCLILVSCGGKESKDVTLTPESATIKGDLKEYFTVVDKPYVIKYDESGWEKYTISIELQRTDVPFQFNTDGIDPVGYSGAGVNGNFGIGIDIRDSDGNIAISWSPTATGLSGVYSSDDLKNLLLLESGESGRVRWTTNDFENYENKNFTFKVSSSLKINKQVSRSEKKKEDAGSSIYDAYADAVSETSRAMKEAQAEAARAMQEAQDEAARMIKEAQRQAGYDFDEW